MHLAGHYYHVHDRGCNREPLFVMPDNYLFLLRKIKTYLPLYPLTLIAYCLMPNHYHFLLRPEEDNALSPFIQRLFNSYTQAFNKQQHRSGTLFEGRAKSIHVKDKTHLIHLCRYIHLNPVKGGIVAHPEDWPYSNYPEWIGQRNGTLKNDAFISEYFSTPEVYRQFVEDYQDAQRVSVDIEKHLWE